MGLTFIEPGRLRTPLDLQAVSLVPDGDGGQIRHWQPVATVFALVEPVSALTRFAAAQALEEISHRVTLRFRQGVTAGMRFVRSGRNLVILTVHDPDETARYLVCLVREDTP